MTQLPEQQQEHEKREALARWVLNFFGTKKERAAWLERFEKRHGTAVTEDIKARMTRIYRAEKEQQQRAEGWG